MFDIREDEFLIEDKDIHVKSITFLGIPIYYKEVSRIVSVAPVKNKIGFASNNIMNNENKSKRNNKGM